MPEFDVLVVGVTESSVTVTPRSTVGSRLQLFLRSIMGGRPTDGGSWELPLRGRSRRELVARLVDRFERDHVPYVLVGEAELEARREVERLRSFQRTLARGRAFKNEGTGLTADTITQACGRWLGLVGPQPKNAPTGCGRACAGSAARSEFLCTWCGQDRNDSRRPVYAPTGRNG